MRLLVELPDGAGMVSPRLRRHKWAPRMYQRHKFIETTVYRIALPDRQDVENPFVWVDAVVLPKDADGIPPLSSGWVGQDVYRAKAYLKNNARSLSLFMASGEREWNVRGRP